jgi:hypothetical protein
MRNYFIQISLWERFGWSPSDTDSMSDRQLEDLHAVLEQARTKASRLDFSKWPEGRFQQVAYAQYYAENDPKIASTIDAVIAAVEWYGQMREIPVNKNLARELLVQGFAFLSGEDVLNPKWHDLDSDGRVVMYPDDELKKVVWAKSPRSMYEAIPEEARRLVLAGRPIPLDASYLTLTSGSLVKKLATKADDFQTASIKSSLELYKLLGFGR